VRTTTRMITLTSAATRAVYGESSPEPG